ncbi:MAG TPA: hypothetical protein VHV76_12215 [Mycobacteriales bacterium]|jgi:hypothetical protein|nr:hypothetical protein [Mycobacteriales bacterium]
MHKISNKKKAAAALGAGALALSGGGVAFAYWTSTGTGAGTAATATTANVTVVQTTPTSSLYPGGNVALVGKFNNSNSGSIRVGTVTATLGTLPSGCVAGDFSITGTAVVNAEIAAGSNVGAWSGITLAMNDTGVSQDACKGQSIPVSYSVS